MMGKRYGHSGLRGKEAHRPLASAASAMSGGKISILPVQSDLFAKRPTSSGVLPDVRSFDAFPSLSRRS